MSDFKTNIETIRVKSGYEDPNAGAGAPCDAPVDQNQKSPDTDSKRTLPGSFEEVVGQSGVVRRLKALVGLARTRESVTDHLLFVGPIGCGKRSLAHVLARQLGVNITTKVGTRHQQAGDLAAAINDLDQGDVLFIENVDRLSTLATELLGSVLNDFEWKITVGKGPGAQVATLQVKPFTLIASVEIESNCSKGLLDSIHGRFLFQPYSEAETTEIVQRTAGLECISIEPAAAALVARAARGNPGHAVGILRRIKNENKSLISEADAREALSLLGYVTRTTATTFGTAAGDWTKLSGSDFVGSVTTLLQKMGFKAEMTKASGDGGMDIEASLDKPIVGGRYLFRCKRFDEGSMVDSTTVRDFYGTLVADLKPTKGVLITTSGFTLQAREFAEKVGIELIDAEKLTELFA